MTSKEKLLPKNNLDNYFNELEPKNILKLPMEEVYTEHLWVLDEHFSKIEGKYKNKNKEISEAAKDIRAKIKGIFDLSVSWNNRIHNEIMTAVNDDNYNNHHLKEVI